MSSTADIVCLSAISLVVHVVVYNLWNHVCVCVCVCEYCETVFRMDSIKGKHASGTYWCGSGSRRTQRDKILFLRLSSCIWAHKSETSAVFNRQQRKTAHTFLFLAHTRCLDFGFSVNWCMRQYVELLKYEIEFCCCCSLFFVCAISIVTLWPKKEISTAIVSHLRKRSLWRDKEEMVAFGTSNYKSIDLHIVKAKMIICTPSTEPRNYSLYYLPKLSIRRSNRRSYL